MKKLVLYFALIFILLLSLCTNETAPKPVNALTSDITFDLPSSVSATQEDIQGGLASKVNHFTRFTNRTESDDVSDILDGVRIFAGVAEDFSVSAKDFFLGLEKDLADFFKNKEWLESESGKKVSDGIVYDYLKDGNNMRIWISFTDYSRHIKIWDKTSSLKLLEASWKGEVQDGKAAGTSGWLIMSGSVLGELPTSIIKMEFNTNDDKWGHSMRIQSAGFVNQEVVNMDLFAAKNEGKVVLVGNTYFPKFGQVDDDENIFADIPRNYVFSASSDVAENIGVIKIALPESTLSSNDYSLIFQDYSIEEIYKDAVYSWLQTNQPALDPNPKDIMDYLVDNYNNGNPIDSANALESILQDEDFSNDAEVQGVLFAFQLDNPVYTKQDGYVTNGISNEPVEYTEISQNVDDASSELKSPEEVAALSSTIWAEFSESIPAYTDFTFSD